MRLSCLLHDVKVWVTTQISQLTKMNIVRFNNKQCSFMFLYKFAHFCRKNCYFWANLCHFALLFVLPCANFTNFCVAGYFLWAYASCADFSDYHTESRFARYKQRFAFACFFECWG